MIAASQPAVYLATRISGAGVTAGFTRIVAAADTGEESPPAHGEIVADERLGGLLRSYRRVA